MSDLTDSSPVPRATAAVTPAPPATMTVEITAPPPFPPLTTPWSEPDSCTWTYDVLQELKSGMAGPIAWLDLEPNEGETTLSCYPPGMFTEGRTGVFSPATCPSGWTTVSVHRNTDEPEEVATTTAVCCSS